MSLSRRKFLYSIGMLSSAALFPMSAFSFGDTNQKLKVVLVGTGDRGISYWGKRLFDNYSDIIEFVGLSDINPGRLEYGKIYIGADCPTFIDFTEMVEKTKPDLVIVTTKDSTHHEFIIKGLDMGCDVLAEKPVTTDEQKGQAIIDAERRSGKKLIIGFNLRWSNYTTKVKELLAKGTIGEITSVDFHWYLNTYHGASYFRRWHGQRESGGTLLVHKSTHHFDLLNWWIDSDPEEVFAYGDLEYYGANGPFRGENCRVCNHKKECKFYWDVTKNDLYMKLYIENEKHDGYIRDNCLFRKEINIYDKMSAQVKYKNNVTLNYSLTTYSPFEGWRVAFNGTKGRIEAQLSIPYQNGENIDQAEMHIKEMEQTSKNDITNEPIFIHKLWEDYEVVTVPFSREGHGGGDVLLQQKIFKDKDMPDPLGRAAGLRDGMMSNLIGIAARKSIESQKLIKIAELTDLEPRKVRLVD